MQSKKARIFVLLKTTTMKTVEQKVREYNGNNSFIRNIQPGLHKYGRLTAKQFEIAEKILIQEEKTNDINVDELSDDLKSIVNYQGANEFVLKMKDQYKTWRRLSDKQIISAVRQIAKESKTPAKTINISLDNESIKIKRGVALKLKKEYNLAFMPILVDMIKATQITEKAVKVTVKMTEENGDVCRCCGATLTDEFSILTGMGAICAKNMGITYIKNVNEVSRFKADLKKRIEEVGEFEFWLPKSQVKEYVNQRRFKFVVEKLWG